MKVEELLKSISSLIKKNERFLISSPEIFKVIETRLHKAIDDDNDYYGDGEGDDYNEDTDFSMSEMFDQQPDDKEIERDKKRREITGNETENIEEDAAAKFLRENAPQEGQEEQPQEDEEEPPQSQPQPKRSSSVHREWSPQDN